MKKIAIIIALLIVTALNQSAAQANENIKNSEEDHYEGQSLLLLIDYCDEEQLNTIKLVLIKQKLAIKGKNLKTQIEKNISDRGFRNQLKSVFITFGIDIDKSTAWILISEYLKRYDNDRSVFETLETYTTGIHQQLDYELTRNGRRLQFRETFILQSKDKAQHIKERWKNRSKHIARNAVKVIFANDKHFNDKNTIHSLLSTLEYQKKILQEYANNLETQLVEYEKENFESVNKMALEIRRNIKILLNYFHSPSNSYNTIGISGYKNAKALALAADDALQHYLTDCWWGPDLAFKLFLCARQTGDLESIYFFYPKFIFVALDVDEPESKVLANKLADEIKLKVKKHQEEKTGFFSQKIALSWLIKQLDGCQSKAYGNLKEAEFIELFQLFSTIKSTIKKYL